MKKIVFLSFTLLSLYASAQDIKLEVGKTFKSTTTMESTTEFMGQESASNIKSISTIKINALEKNSYKATSSSSSLVLGGNLMGQDLTFDSNKKEDAGSEMGKIMSNSATKSYDLEIDNKTGDIKDITPEKAEKDQNDAIAEMIMGGMKFNTNLFLPLVKGKKLGDKWSDSTTIEGMKNVTNYEVTIVNGNTITIATSGTLAGTGTKDLGGQSMEVTTDTKKTGSIVVDSNTFVIKQISSVAESNNNIEAGGRTITTTSKVKITTLVE